MRSKSVRVLCAIRFGHLIHGSPDFPIGFLFLRRSPEVHVDMLDAGSAKTEKFRIAGKISVLLLTGVNHEDFIPLFEYFLDMKSSDIFVVGPALFKVLALVDVFIIRTAEGEVICEEMLDDGSMLCFVSQKVSSDEIR